MIDGIHGLVTVHAVAYTLFFRCSNDNPIRNYRVGYDMESSKSVIACEAIVNGERIPAHDIGFLYQENPFPGDARYTIALQLRMALTRRRWPALSESGYGIHTDITHKVARRCLQDIEWLMASTIDRSTREIHPNRYFVNTLERLSLRVKELHAEGVCSTVIH